jgi:hypothetical protein
MQFLGELQPFFAISGRYYIVAAPAKVLFVNRSEFKVVLNE